MEVNFTENRRIQSDPFQEINKEEISLFELERKTRRRIDDGTYDERDLVIAGLLGIRFGISRPDLDLTEL